ncbi:MAG: hypothetical protein HYY02_11435 [Chloroflexi bacterium]|nr:hypothetical protein [Chloroflexota bacterium]
MTAQRQLEAPDSLEEINALYYERHMTDGLPIVPPTAERVGAMLKVVDRDPQELLGTMAPRWAPCTIQKVAINAVIAGCLPEYFPVVVAAVECVLQENFNLYGVQATTNPIGPCFLVNGPIRQELQMNGGYNLFGPGNRANATIGRAVRLVLLNVGGGVPGDLDRATQGWPGKYTLCFPESEEQSPWDPYSVDRGFAKGANTITLFGIGGFTNLADLHSNTAVGVLGTFCRLIAMGGGTPSGGSPLIVICPEHAEIMARDGMSKADVKKYLFENARVKPSGFTATVAEEWLGFRNRQTQVSGSNAPEFTLDSWGTMSPAPEHIQIAVGGGAGCHSALLSPSFGGVGTIVTREIIK